MPEAGPDPGASLEALVAVLSPLFEERCYKGGAYLAAEGHAADSLIYIEEGEADICFSMRQRADEDLLDDEEEVGPINYTCKWHMGYTCIRYMHAGVSCVGSWTDRLGW